MKTQIKNELKASHAEVQRDPTPGEFCICQNCKKRVKNPRGALYSNTQCPECGAYLISEWS